MSASWCPYCNSVQSLLLGNVYCSRQATAMGDLETGTLFIKAKSLEETDDHVSRLSIRCMLKGEQHYRVGGNEHLVTPQKYLVVNQGQHYRTSFSGSEEQEMILVAFKPGFAESVFTSLMQSEEQLLDEPFVVAQDSLLFFEKTYDHDPFMHSLFMTLRSLMNLSSAQRKELGTDILRKAQTEEIYTALLLRLLHVHRGLTTDINKLRSSKKSTRVELFRRLSIARDFMEANLHLSLTLEDIAQKACLSLHHFKREFKDLFGVSPHRYLVNRRIEKAQQLLGQGYVSIEEVCRQTGFENTSSFIRLFRERTGSTPGRYRAR